jgi:tetratricopeptide (TPR) repeat protein
MKKWMTVIIMTFYAILLFSCATTNRSPGLSMTATKSNYKYHTPAEIYEIMDKSDVRYKIEEVEDLKPFNLVQHSTESYPISPYHRIVYESADKYTIIIDEPKGRIADIFNQAAQELQNDNFKAVRKLYEEALSIDSGYFKTWTNLGDTYYLLGDYETAEGMLKKSIAMNDIGYQEYFFLADVYDKMGRTGESIDAIAHAFMLNKNSLNLQKALHRLLADNGLGLREDRLEFPFQIRKTGVSECEIKFRNKDGLNWMAMANCMACWEMEPAFHSRLQSGNRWLAKVNMYKECIFNQGIMVENKKKKGKELTKNEELLREALFGKYINAIVYWEILAGEIPMAILLLPRAERETIVEYIKQYVFEKRSEERDWTIEK